MSAEYTSNHYVPQWYQRRFIPAGQTNRELYLLDLRPDTFRDGRGVRHRLPAVKRTGTRKCFAIDDLYTTRLDGSDSHELERVFFGDVDTRGKRAVEFFAGFDHDALEQDALHNLMLFMSTQKLRTPKGLDWMAARADAQRRDVLRYLAELRSVYGAIWAECVWQLADLSNSETKLVVSDHPVTVYNRSCSPANPRWCRGPNDPDVRLHATHTLFPLSSDRLLILTNLSWACDPYRPPLELRPNPDFFRGAVFNFLDIQTGRQLSEEEVLKINWIFKRRAYRYIAAGREEWLYPEERLSVRWRAIGDEHLLMPDPRCLHPGAEITMGYAGGATESIDTFGRGPGHPQFGHESRDRVGIQRHRRWCEEFEALVGPGWRGSGWEGRHHRREGQRANS